MRVESKDITEREAVAEFRIMQAELTSHDLTYIISQVEDEGPLKRFSFAVLSEHCNFHRRSSETTAGDDEAESNESDSRSESVCRANCELRCVVPLVTHPHGAPRVRPNELICAGCLRCWTELDALIVGQAWRDQWRADTGTK